MKFSASLLKRWMSCPLQVKFADMNLNVPDQSANMTFGTCVHEALELYNTTFDPNQAIERFKYTWKNPEELGCAIDYWPARTTYKDFLKMGIAVITDYHEKNRLQERTVIATEHKFCVPYGDHFISGVVDLLEFTFDSHGWPVLNIIDFKTNSRKPTKLELAMDIQFTTYYYASMQPEFWFGNLKMGSKYKPMEDGEDWFEIFSDENAQRKVWWHHLRTLQKIDAGIRDDNDFLRMYRLIMEVTKAVEADVYIPSIKPDSCMYCPYTDQCATVGPVADRIITSRYRSTPLKLAPPKKDQPKEKGYQGDRWL